MWSLLWEFAGKTKGLSGFSDEGFMDKEFEFGTIALCSDIEESPEKLYSLYKTKGEIKNEFGFLCFK